MALCMALTAGSTAWAGTANQTHALTVKVGDILSITVGEDPNFTLTFDTDFGNGAVSTGKTFSYIIRSNTMPLSALAGAISAKISATLSGINIKAFPGDYTNEGVAGYATLTKTTAETVVGTTAVALADKPASAGANGKLLKGTFPIHYRAVATRDLSTADGGTVTLTVTLKDS